MAKSGDFEIADSSCWFHGIDPNNSKWPVSKSSNKSFIKFMALLCNILKEYYKIQKLPRDFWIRSAYLIFFELPTLSTLQSTVISQTSKNLKSLSFCQKSQTCIIMKRLKPFLSDFFSNALIRETFPWIPKTFPDILYTTFIFAKQKVLVPFHNNDTNYHFTIAFI